MLYQPIPKMEPVTRQRLIANKAKVVDAWREEGELIQLYRTPAGQNYKGKADSHRNTKAFHPVRPVID